MDQFIYITPSAHYFALDLQYVISLNALTDNPAEFLTNLYNRQVDFLSSLTNAGDERLTIDLRIMSRPEPSLYTRGRIRVALLGKLQDASIRESQTMVRSVRSYLEASFPEYHFTPGPADSLPELLTPFSFKSGAEIMRMCEPIRLDTLRNDPNRRTFGFHSGGAAHGTATYPDGIVHIAPFLFTNAAFDRFFKLLLLEPSPVLTSIMVHPTVLTESEGAFIENQITMCERFSQAGLDSISEPSALHAAFPTLREQARSYQRSQVRLLTTLQASAALLQIRVASPGPLPPAIVHSFGSLITEAAGSKGATDREPEGLAGGCSVLPVQAVDMENFARALSELSIDTRNLPGAQGGLQRLPWLFEPTNAACAFRFPPPPAEELPGVTTRSWRTRMVPPAAPPTGTLIGTSEDASAHQMVYLGIEDRRRHQYVIGQTGTGKTTLLKTMILSDINGGMGVCVIDPHGDMFKEILGRIPENRIDDVVILDPTDIEAPVGLNLLECGQEAERHFVAQEVVAIMTKLIADEFGVTNAQAYAGPMFYQHVRNNLLLAMSNPDDPGTLLEFYMIFQDGEFWRRWIPLATNDPLLQRWTANTLKQTDYTRPGSEGGTMGSYVSSKFEPFVFDPLLRNIFGQKRSTIDFGTVMDEGRILLVNLAKGELTEANSRFLGLVLMAKLQAAVMERARLDKTSRKDFNIYIDEFQSIATRNFVTLLSEGRKFRVNLNLATQFVTQVDPMIVGSILGNVGTIICFRLGQLDAEQMEKEFLPVFNRHDLLNLPNWHACVTTQFDGQTVAPFSIRTVPDETGKYDEKRAAECRSVSRRKYGKPIRQVEQEIAKSVKAVAKEE